MLPFRGVQVALLSRRSNYGDMVHFTTSSGTFDMDGLTAARMGKFSVHAIFGKLDLKRKKPFLDALGGQGGERTNRPIDP